MGQASETLLYSQWLILMEVHPEPVRSFFQANNSYWIHLWVRCPDGVIVSVMFLSTLTKSWGCVPFKQTLIFLMLHHIVWGTHHQRYCSSEAALNFGSAEWLQGGCLEPKCLYFPPGSFHSHWDAPPHLPPLLVPPLRPLYHHCRSLMCNCWSSLFSLG